jgi:hypothetical protein
MTWAGKYIMTIRPDVIICMGDLWDMPSLSSYDAGKKASEGARYRNDIDAGNIAIDALLAPMRKYNKVRARNKKAQYKPELHFCIGNHEQRIVRHVNANPILEGALSYKDFNLTGWKVHDFLQPVEIDGVTYCHYFAHPNTGKPYTGMMETRLKNIGFSFTQGHAQGKAQAERELPNGKLLRGLSVGSFYLHDEAYRGPQAQKHWRGIIVKHEVHDGEYDLMEISVNYLCRTYEGRTLEDYHARCLST